MTAKVNKANLDAFAEQEEVRDETMVEYITRIINNKFVDSIPIESIKELPPTYMYLLGFLTHALTTAVFIIFILRGYRDAITTEFMSLDSEAGLCQAVKRSVDGEYLADAMGHWSGDISYDPSLAKYSLEFRAFSHTDSEYQQMMANVSEHLDVLGRQARRRDLAQNILVWMSWEMLLPYTNTLNKFRMLGSPLIVFDRDSYFGIYSSIAGECVVPSQSNFDKSTATFEVIYDYSQFVKNSVCKAAATPTSLGYQEDYDHNKFAVSLDTRTAAMASAINSGIIDVNSLSKVTVTQKSFQYKNETAYLTERFSERYPGMDSMVCLEFIGKDFCVIRMGEIYGFPVFNHFGTDQGFPKKCDCLEGDHIRFHYCNDMDFMIGMIFYNLPSGSGDDAPGSNLPKSALALFELMVTTNNVLLNTFAYNISYAASMYNSSESAAYATSEWRERAFRFCTLETFGACSILLFNTYDDVSHAVTEYNYDMSSGACRDTFTSNNWKSLMEEPPTELQEDYFKCTEEKTDAIFESIGIASGNTATFIPLILLAILPLVYMYLQVSGYAPPKEEYTHSEVQAAMEAIAIATLRIRDGKVRGIIPNGILKQLTSELAHSARAESGFPDSDDESDDEGGEEDLADIESGDGGKEKRAPGGARESHGPLRSRIFSSKDGASTPQDSSSVWSWFGGSSSSDKPPSVAAAGATNPLQRVSDVGKRLGDIRSGDLMVLNELSSSTHRKSTKAITSDAETEKLVQSLKVGMEKSIGVRDLDGGGGVFRTAQNKSIDLKNVQIKSLCAAAEAGNLDVRQIFQALLCSLHMHASLLLQCSLEECQSSQMCDTIGYNIGGRIFTGTDIQSIIESGSPDAPLRHGMDAADVQSSSSSHIVL